MNAVTKSALVGLAGAALLLAPASGAGQTITPADREAITVRSLTATDDPSLGLIVTATFDGDVQRELGQGALKNAALALVLTPAKAGQPGVPQSGQPGVPQSGQPGAPQTGQPGAPQSGQAVATQTELPAGVIDSGGGIATVTIRRRTLTTLAVEHTVSVGLTTPRPTVVRDDNRITFWLPGVTLGAATTIRIRSFARGLPGLMTTVRSTTVSPYNAAWSAAFSSPATSAGTATVTPAALTTAQLTAESDRLTADAANINRELTSAQTSHESTAPTRTAPKRPTSRAAVTQLQRTAAAIKTFRAEITALRKATAAPAVQVTQTDTGLNQLMAKRPGAALTNLQPTGIPEIPINPHDQAQTFEGLGAAMTDSSAALIEDDLQPATQTALMAALFGGPGTRNALNLPPIGLTALRIGIGAPGAMTVGPPYSDDDLTGTTTTNTGNTTTSSTPAQPTDPTLSQFAIAPSEQQLVIPALEQALAVNPDLMILASPWSPPAWMKSNDALGNPDGDATLLPADDGSYAQYIVDFIKAYAADGVPVTAITPQNEPSEGDVSTIYPGLTLPETDEATLISQYLAPALRNAGLTTAIYGFDQNWSYATYATQLASGPADADLAGIAWHCYFGSPAAMSDVAQLDPTEDQIVSECSPEIRPAGTPESLISSLRDGASRFIVWSVALDPDGGPIQPGNDCSGCRGPITIDEDSDAVTARPEYYRLGQLSAFVQPGAVRLQTPNFVTYGTNAAGIETVSAGLDDVAFENPDGSMVLVANNTSTAPITFAVTTGTRSFTDTIPAGAMTTFRWSAG